MGEGNLLNVNKALKKYYSVVRYLKKRDTYRFISRENQFDIPLDKGNPGFLYDESLRKIAKVIGNETGKESNEIFDYIISYKSLTEKRRLKKLRLEEAVTPIIILLSVGLVTLILSQTKLLTGYAISNISNTTSNIGIFICIVGIVGLLILKFKKK